MNATTSPTINPSANFLSPTQLASYLDTLLQCGDFQDYCPNGLQVDGGNGAWASYGANSSIINDGQGNQTSSTATGTVVKDAQNNTTQVGSKGVLLLSPDGSEMANLSQLITRRVNTLQAAKTTQ